MEEMGKLMNSLLFHLEMKWQVGLTVLKEPKTLSVSIKSPRKAEGEVHSLTYSILTIWYCWKLPYENVNFIFNTRKHPLGSETGLIRDKKKW